MTRTLDVYLHDRLAGWNRMCLMISSPSLKLVLGIWDSDSMRLVRGYKKRLALDFSARHHYLSVSKVPILRWEAATND